MEKDTQGLEMQRMDVQRVTDRDLRRKGKSKIWCHGCNSWDHKVLLLWLQKSSSMFMFLPTGSFTSWIGHQILYASWAVTLGLTMHLCLFCACAKVTLRINCDPWWPKKKRKRYFCCMFAFIKEQNCVRVQKMINYFSLPTPLVCRLSISECIITISFEGFYML